MNEFFIKTLNIDRNLFRLLFNSIHFDMGHPWSSINYKLAGSFAIVLTVCSD